MSTALECLCIVVTYICELGLTDRQAQLLRGEREVDAIPTGSEGMIIDVDMDNNSEDGEHDGRDWTDEGEAYLIALRDTVRTGCVIHSSITFT